MQHGKLIPRGPVSDKLLDFTVGNQRSEKRESEADLLRITNNTSYDANDFNGFNHFNELPNFVVHIVLKPSP
jgi:hypothetical protein